MGPNIDPEGWITVKSTPITGRIFNDRTIRATATVSCRMFSKCVYPILTFQFSSLLLRRYV